MGPISIHETDPVTGNPVFPPDVFKRDMRSYRPASSVGEKCYCGKDAVRKVEETIFHDDPWPNRHPFTAYLCAEHFRQIMGPATDGIGEDIRT